jgi:hypothetical protein
VFMWYHILFVFPLLFLSNLLLVVDSFNPLDSFIWLEFYGSPSDRDVDIVGSVSISCDNILTWFCLLPPIFFFFFNKSSHTFYMVK